MNIALAFHPGDQDQAARWLSWVRELGGAERHALFAMPAKSCVLPADFFQPAKEAFASVTIVPDAEGVRSEWSASNDPVRDASGPNSTVRQFAWHFFVKKLGPWLFMEPDAIPLCSEWIDRIEAEYHTAGKPFMGGVVRVPNVPVHSTGIMVLPQNAALCQGLVLNRHTTIEGKRVVIAFDVASADEVLPRHHETRLIQHVFRGPVFESREQFERDVWPEAVLFHTDKTGSLLPFLREKMGYKINPEWEVDVQITYPPDPPDGWVPQPYKPTVYTYFGPCEGREALEEQHKLIELWKQSWSANGWNPVVLTIEDAKRHPRFEEFEKGFQSLPIENPPIYELSCFRRWVAMAAIGRGLMTDYDVMNNGLSPEYELALAGDRPTLLCGHVPCAVLAFGPVFEKCAEWFISSRTKSDMHAFASDSASHESEHLCVEYRAEGWQSAPLIHFSHGRCRPKKRSDVIDLLLAKREPSFCRPGELSNLILGTTEPSSVSIKDHIAAIKVEADKGGFAYLRLIKQLRAAGIIRTKPVKRPKRKAAK